MRKFARNAWPYLNTIERVLFITFAPLLVLAWASIWIICAAYSPRGAR